MKLDDIIPLLGNFGRYQFFMVCYMGSVSIVLCLTILGNVFYAAGTGHWCSVLPEENCSGWTEFRDNCTEVKRSLFSPLEGNDSTRPYSSCKQWELPDGYVFDPDVPLDDADNETLEEVPCEDGWEYDRSQYRSTTVTDFNLVCDDINLPGLAQSIYFAGFLVGSLVMGTVSDWCGRKRSLLLGLLFWFVGFIVTSFSVNIYMYTAFRFLAGFGGIGAYISTYVLLLEVVGQAWRNAVTMIAGIFFAVGYFILATAAMFVRDWRTLSLVLSVPSVVLLFPVIFVQESIRWLVSKGRIDEAETVLRRVAKFNMKTLPDVLFDQADAQEQMESQKSKIPPSAIDLYRSPNMLLKTLNLQFNWMVNNLVYYGLSQSTGELGVNIYWAFFVSGAVEIPALFYAVFGVEWFGRKWNTAVLELIGGIACLATIFIPTGIWRTVVSMVGKFCISVTFSLIYLYSIEVFPTPVRAVGVGVCSIASRIGAILSPVILLSKHAAADLPLILFGSSAVIAGLLVFFLPETKGRKLPQTLKEGEEIGKCRCLRRGADDQSAIDLYETNVNKDSAAILTDLASN
ncbi:solute carrier family 22 member 13-like [Acanthaster planci]|uniref:Solute carrier family 22 member 13-like n=1 Tax=Acanthaster planci TaxID=133434 RepID=A0A8B7ZZJ2_ACAPL|nr:solute carrier family 22 member 13-like [Acanthaster planci]